MRGSILLLLLLAACRTAGPSTTLDAYLAAVQAGRLPEAYGYMSAEYRKTHDLTTFTHAVSTLDKKASARLRGGHVTLEADVELGEGEHLPMVYEDGAWRVARDPLDFYPQATPQEALRSFMRAVDNKRWDVVLRFVPARYRTTITADKLRDRWEGERRVELKAQLDLARAHLAEPFAYAPSGEEATLPLNTDEAAKKQVRLVREDGAWKVESLE